MEEEGESTNSLIKTSSSSCLPQFSDSAKTPSHLQTLTFAIKNPFTDEITIQTVFNSLSLRLQQQTDPILIQQTLNLLHKVALLYQNLRPLIVDTIRSHLPRWMDINHSLSVQALTSLVSISTSSVSSVVGSLLGEDLLRSLLSSPNASVRARILNLLALDAELDRNSVSSSVYWPHFLFRVFLRFTRDPYPYVRSAAFEGLVLLVKNVGAENVGLMEGCYYRGVELLRDHDEVVRLSAVRMISEWGKLLGNASGETCSQDRLDVIFLQLSTMARDMSMVIRTEAFLALGKMRQVSEEVLLQTLSKKVLGLKNDRKVLHQYSGNEFVSMISSAAGAFVHGLEDEFFQVRRVACNSLGLLAVYSTQFADGALKLLMDLLNDDTMIIRLQTLHAMFHMAESGHLKLQELHMHMFLSVLMDIDPLIRSSARRLLRSMELPDPEIFNSSINGLLTNLRAYPEDKVDIFSVLNDIGKSHAEFSASFVKKFAQEIEPAREGELGLDRTEVAVALVLAVVTPSSNDQISNFAARVFSYALPLLGSVSWCLGDIINKDSLLVYLCNCKSPMPTPNSKEDKIFLDVAGECNLNCNLEKRIFGIDTSQQIKDGASEVQLANNLSSPKPLIFLPEEARSAITHILKVVQLSWPSIKSGCTAEVLRTLRHCKEELAMISVPSHVSVGELAFASQYIKVIQLLTEIWDDLQPNKFCVGIRVLDLLLKKLDRNLRSMRYTFLGLSRKEEIHVLELILLSCVLKLSKGRTCHVPPILKKLHAAMSRAELLCKKGPCELSDFAKELKKSCGQGEVGNIPHQFPASRLVESFSPEQIVPGGVKHIKAELQLPGDDSENPLPFIAGLPVGITCQIKLYNISSRDKIWLQMVAGELIEYNYLDLTRFEGCHEVRNCTIDVPFYRTPKAASFSLRVCAAMECPFEDTIPLSKGQGGPKRELTYLCKEKEIYLTTMKTTIDG